MSKINLNELAAEIAKEEGGAVEQNIAQIKETLGITLRKLALYKDEEILEVINRLRRGRRIE